MLLARKHRLTSSQVPAHWRVSVALPPDYFFHMSRPRYYVWLAYGTYRAARAAARADLVHAIKDYPHNRIALAAAQAAGKPCIATAHGTYTIQPLLDPRHASRARKTYRGFARMISVSRYTKKRLEEILPAAELPRVEVIPNAVSAAHYEGARDIGPRPWHSVPFTLGIGEIKERKGHHLGLEAWCEWRAIDRPAPFPRGGNVRGAYQGACSRSRARRASRPLHLLGSVSQDEKIDLLQRACLFLHAGDSRDGGFEGFARGGRRRDARDRHPRLWRRGRDRRRAYQSSSPTVDRREGLRELLGNGPSARRWALALGARASSWRANAERVLAIYREALG